MTRSRSMLWMSLALLLLGIALLMPDLIVYTRPPLRSRQSGATSPSGASSSASLMDSVTADEDESPADSDDPQRLDVRGNEIARPVARYRVDERGSLYEVHSPQTEVPRLKPPLM